MCDRPLSARGGLPTRRTTYSARGWRCSSRPGLARRSAARRAFSWASPVTHRDAV